MKAVSAPLLAYLNRSIAMPTYLGGSDAIDSGTLGQGQLGTMILGQTASETSTTNLTARGADRHIKANLFTLTLRGGQQYFYTDADVPVTVFPSDTASSTSGVLGLGALGGMILGQSAETPLATFEANSVRIDGLKYKLSCGVDVDEQDITVSATSADQILGVPFLRAVRLRLLDGATLQRDLAFLSSWGGPPIGTVTLFHGRISSVDKVGRTEAQIKVKSDLNLLNIDYPRNDYQASCLNTWGDANCGVSKAAYAVAGTVGAGPSAQVLPWTGATAGYFDQGTVTFLNGPNAGSSVTTDTATGAALVLSVALPYLPLAGDTFTAYPGCDHTNGTGGCVKFANLINFRGYPFVPLPSTAY